MSSDREQSAFDAASDDEDDWEEVLVDHQPEKPIEITLQVQKSKAKPEDAAKKKGISYAERLLRIDCHKFHTVILIGNAKIRNEWLNDELLHARLLSLTPLTLQNEFAMIHKSRIPDQGQRGRAFERAMQHLAEWWAHSFFEVLPEGHLRNRTFDEVQSKLERHGVLDDPEPLDEETTELILDEDLEIIRGPKSLMKHALMRCGSRDVSAQLFTALCRALGIPARLVVSLQSMPWKASVGKPKPKYTRKSAKGKEKAVDDEEDSGSSPSKVDVKGKGKAPAFEGPGRRLDGTPVPKSEKAKGKEKAKPVIKLRKQRDKGHRLGDSRDSSPGPSKLASPDPTTTPPVFWTEVFSRPDGRWLPVDPIRSIVNKRKVFDPTPLTNAPGTGAAVSTASSSTGLAFPQTTRKSNVPRGFKEENRMLYVLAFEEDGYARDVTRRYAREYNARVLKAQGGSRAANAGKARQEWWDKVVTKFKRPYQLHRDDVEDEELAQAQMTEGMPTTIAGFKDHPVYVLERHLKQTEVIHPPPPETPELGKFRGEPVYPRSSVIPLKTAETWLRTEGRMIKAGCQPLKTVKARPGTLNRQRELEVLKDELRDAGFSGDASGEVMQGLYARSQTELYVPDPIVDAYWETQRHEEEKARAKKEEQALKHWVKLVQGLRIRQRLQEQYADRSQSTTKAGPSTSGKRAKRGHPEDEEQAPNDDDEKFDSTLDDTHGSGSGGGGGGGFLVEADDVVQAFHLPKYNPILLLDSTSSNPFARSRPLGSAPGGDTGPGAAKHSGAAATGENAEEGRDLDEQGDREPERVVIDYVTYDLEDEEGPEMDGDGDEGGLIPTGVDKDGDVDMDRPGGDGTPGPPLTADTSPLSLADLEAGGLGGRQGSSIERDDDDATKDDDEFAPRTMQDLLEAEAAKAKSKPKPRAKPRVSLKPVASPSGSEGGLEDQGQDQDHVHADIGAIGDPQGQVVDSEEGSSGPLLQGRGGRVNVNGNVGSVAGATIIGSATSAANGGLELSSSSLQSGRQLRSSRKGGGGGMVAAASDGDYGEDGGVSVSATPRSRKGTSGGGKRKRATVTGGSARKKVSVTRAKGRRKKRKDESDEEDDEGEEDIDDIEGDDVDDAPRKRTRVTPGEDVGTTPSVSVERSAPAATPAGGRSLRPRRSKTAAQLEQEREAEKAYRRAIAQ
ncbi:DNA repair protein rhp42 [Coprinopsis cinerea okayama7|uniref:DNA repair protein rhp42 n=1 Tax=Coprinopsis cinerea (strain Okayama-7 / 130 / ATCC MYA-4618 / FGSC 9003) TaxID=240176 RepID=A8NQG4_COPC7|nr:DNA repair protein rhp42 [Coprinopsis cinerea okayama7\|eukprot:XP_001835551.2 DNA repair protein rhp42 [Coprinopsis cinerea okayama7\